VRLKAANDNYNKEVPVTVNPDNQVAPILRPEDLGPAERLTLSLMRLTCWQEDPIDLKPGWQPRVRSWKGYAFWCLKRLADAGLIEDRNGTKTVIVTESGCAWSEEVLVALGIEPRAIQTRTLPPRPPE